MKVEITKLYLVQVMDKDGNEIAYEYVVGDKADAVAVGKSLKENLKKENNTCNYRYSMIYFK